MASESPSAFSTLARREIEIHFDFCWACENVAVDACQHAPVVSQHEKSEYLRDMGILPFQIGSPKNGIMLCGTCHGLFGRDLNPVWLFFPADLEFFINYELRDRQERAQAQGPRPRRVPDASTYLEHQKDSRAVPADATEPLYDRYVLSPEVWLTDPGIRGQKGWFGHPLAAIRSAWRVLAALRGDKVPLESRNQLQHLLELYRTPLSEVAVLPALPPPPQGGPSPPDNGSGPKRKRAKTPKSPQSPKSPKGPKQTTIAGRLRSKGEGASKRSREDIMEWLDGVTDGSRRWKPRFSKCKDRR